MKTLFEDIAEKVQRLENLANFAIFRPASSTHIEAFCDLEHPLLFLVIGKEQGADPKPGVPRHYVLDLKTFSILKRPGELQVVSYKASPIYNLRGPKVSKLKDAKPGEGILIAPIPFDAKAPEGGWVPTHIVAMNGAKSENVHLAPLKDRAEMLVYPPEMAILIFDLEMTITRDPEEKPAE